MMVSNVSVAFVAILAAVIVIKKDKKRFKMMKAAI